ncbi:conjugal transfer protein MobB [Dysgonomonas sp.]
MLAKISSGKSVFGVLAYNKIKVEDNQADVLYSQKMFDSADGKFSIQDCMDSFYPYLAKNNRTEKVVFHASLNPDPKDKLSDERLSEIAQRYMEKLGYGNQPYIVFKHSDIDRTHAHIVSLRIDETGKKINDSYEVVRSMKICKELEQEFNLIPLKKGQRESEAPTKKIDYKAGDIKHQVGNIAKSVMNHFYFQSFGEYRTLLEQFNVTVEEVKGEHKGKPYRGLIYPVIDNKGEKIGVPIKSSKFGKSVGYDVMQKHFEHSKTAIEKNRIRENLRPVIAKAMKEAKNIDDFKLLLKEKGIGAIFRQNEQGRIYGVTFIDYQNQAILNGSRLGKEFSANQFQNLLSNSSVKKEKAEQQTPIKPQSERASSPSLSLSGITDAASSLFSLFDIEPQRDNSEDIAFAKEKEWEEKQRQRSAKRRKPGRQI